MFHMHTLVLTFTPLVALISLEYVYSAEIGTGTADFLSGSAASVFLLHLDLCVPSLSVLGFTTNSMWGMTEFAYLVLTSCIMLTIYHS